MKQWFSMKVNRRQDDHANGHYRGNSYGLAVMLAAFTLAASGAVGPNCGSSRKTAPPAVPDKPV